MISSRNSKRNAAISFVLIAALVIGGMSWATVSQLRLAQSDLDELSREQWDQQMREREDDIRLAIEEMERVIWPMLVVEDGRPWGDYQKFTPLAKTFEWTEDGRRLRAARPDQVIMLSPLMEGPSSEWIDLHFQVIRDEQGGGSRWTSPQSPQLYEELETRAEFRPWELAGDAAVSDYGVQRQLKELERTISFGQLEASIERAYARAGDDTPAEFTSTQLKSRPNDRQRSAARRERRGSGRRSRELQRSLYLEIVESRPPPPDRLPAPDYRMASEADYDEVFINWRELRAFWLNIEKPDDEKMLAFVRRVEVDEYDYDEQGQPGECETRTQYQGFTVPWNRLKPALLDALPESLIGAELLPVSAQGDDASSVGSPRLMRTIPVWLQVPEEDFIPSTTRQAWASVGGPLAITWALALGVLAVVGLGFRNLVSLTERRLQFAYGVTHELRTPLTTFQLYSDMLAAGLVPEESIPEYLTTLKNESKRLSDLVEGVLEYARLENHKVQLNPTAMGGTALVDLIRSRFLENCDRNGIELVIENDLAIDRVFRSDFDLTAQIIGVVVNNACRYARGSDDPKVLIGLTDHDGGSLQIDVRDTGPGIERADAKRIFKPFRRGRGPTKAAQGGIGLGLALARNWAKILGGRLELMERCDPTYGGAHFRLTIPAKLLV